MEHLIQRRADNEKAITDIDTAMKRGRIPESSTLNMGDTVIPLSKTLTYQLCDIIKQVLTKQNDVINQTQTLHADPIVDSL